MSFDTGAHLRGSSLPNLSPPRLQEREEEYNDSRPFTVGYVYSEKMTEHFCITGHPEQPERIIRIWQAIQHHGLHKQMKMLRIVIPTKDEVCLVHTEDLWNMVQAISNMSEEDILDPEQQAFYERLSIYVNGVGTTRSALLSCGGVIQACLEVVEGTVQKAFAIVRPPGHHAEPNEHMGFCFFNNVAVAARVVQTQTDTMRIMIVDWDVHHGNGTQAAFNDDPNILYISLHRYDGGAFYPGGNFGALESCGVGDGEGFSINIPWPGPGMGDADYIYAFMKIIMPIATLFDPELVIISAGFDAVDGDPLGGCLVTPVGYSHMIHMLSSLAGGKLVVALEGGYHLDATANAALAVTKTLIVGYPQEPLPSLVPSSTAREVVWNVAKQQSHYWPVAFDWVDLEPRDEVEAATHDGLATYHISEIIRAHREEYLSSSGIMMQFPLQRDYFEKGFGTQVFGSMDIQINTTLVVLVHEFGNLRTEFEASRSCDINLAMSNLLDTSKTLKQWVHQAGYALLDINLYPKPAEMIEITNPDSLKRGIVTYLWDNFLQLSRINQLVLVGQGLGCEPMMKVISDRFEQCQLKVKGIIQIVDKDHTPKVPKLVESREWYKECSYVVVPNGHRVFDSDMEKKNYRRHGKVESFVEKNATMMVSAALPEICSYILSKLDTNKII